MTDDQLTELFHEGTAPERDAAFVRRVTARIGRPHWRLALAARAAVALTLAGAAFITIRALNPELTQLAESMPHFMGVPVPLVLGALLVGAALPARLYLRLRLA